MVIFSRNFYIVDLIDVAGVPGTSYSVDLQQNLLYSDMVHRYSRQQGALRVTFFFLSFFSYDRRSLAKFASIINIENCVDSGSKQAFDYPRCLGVRHWR